MLLYFRPNGTHRNVLNLPHAPGNLKTFGQDRDCALKREDRRGKDGTAELLCQFKNEISQLIDRCYVNFLTTPKLMTGDELTDEWTYIPKMEPKILEHNPLFTHTHKFFLTLFF